MVYSVYTCLTRLLPAPYFNSQPFEGVRATLASSNDWTTVMEVATAAAGTFVFTESPTKSLSITCDVSGSPTLSYACKPAYPVIQGSCCASPSTRHRQRVHCISYPFDVRFTQLLLLCSDVNRLKNLNRLKMSFNRLIIAINRLIAIKNFNRLID